MNWISASVKGVKPARVPNQDFIKVVEGEHYLLAVLSDGLGSAKYSRLGAKLACESVFQSSKNRSGSNNAWVKSIPAIWKKLVQQSGKSLSECSTTCAFTYVDSLTRTITYGVTGDTSVFVKSDVQMIGSGLQLDEFLNETACLGGSNVQDFTVEEIAYSRTFEILLATDGIAVDLEPNRIPDFMSFLSHKCDGLSQSKSRAFLRRNIADNFSPMNDDDKSMIFAWQKN